MEYKSYEKVRIYNKKDYCDEDSLVITFYNESQHFKIVDELTFTMSISDADTLIKELFEARNKLVDAGNDESELKRIQQLVESILDKTAIPDSSHDKDYLQNLDAFDSGLSDSDLAKLSNPASANSAESKPITKENLDLTDEDISDIMCAALGSIGYWCKSIEPVESRSDESVPDVILDGTVVVKVFDDSISYKLTREGLLGGIVDYLNSKSCYLEISRNGDKVSFDIGQVDDEVSDCMLQYALFGELVYG